MARAKKTTGELLLPAQSKDRGAFYKRLITLGAVYCPTCNAYQFPTHPVCNAFDIAASLGRFGHAMWSAYLLSNLPQEDALPEAA